MLMKRDPLVTVDEGVILDQSESVRGRELGKFDTLVVPLVAWPLQRRAQQALVTQAWRSPKAAKLQAVRGYRLFVSEPTRLGHFASADSVSRYSSMISSTISIVFSKSGS